MDHHLERQVTLQGAINTTAQQQLAETLKLQAIVLAEGSAIRGMQFEFTRQVGALAEAITEANRLQSRSLWRKIRGR